ncbi:TWK-29 protein [Aphelenchoides avenae]|nr:TWK-29 protein [Aphelenchus avenae]
MRCFSPLMSFSGAVKSVAANFFCVGLLVVYVVIGGFIFLHFEAGNSAKFRQEIKERRHQCILDILASSDDNASESKVSYRIARDCLANTFTYDRQRAWNIRNSMLYGFGILTTLGYGKIEPMTLSGRMFTVGWGFLGVPIALIILTNIGLCIRRMERLLRKQLFRYCSLKKKDAPLLGNKNDENNNEEGNRNSDVEDANDATDRPSIINTVALVALYLAFGALFLPMLNGRFDFINGLYYSYLCFTAIEYGKLIPDNVTFIPIALAYMCIGLALSTIALDIVSAYVRRLYYVGREAGNLENVLVWVGYKRLRVKELLSALGVTIGLNPATLCDLDLEQLVHVKADE